MAESVVLTAANHIGRLLKGGSIKAYIFNVVPEATAICSHLKDIEKSLVEIQKTKDVVNNVQVGSLLKEARKFAFDAEDVIDTYVFVTQSSSDLYSLFAKLSRSYPTFKELKRLCMKMQDVKAKLDACKEESSEEGKTMNLPDNNPMAVGGSHGRQSSNGNHESSNEFVGIKDDVEKLVTILTVDANHIDVLAIVGMGGSGKTSLARLIYNHTEIKKIFKYQVWVSVSQGCTSFELSSEICRQLPQKKTKSSTWWKNLWRTTHKCLIVLDNVWDCKPLQEKPLLELFQRDIHLKNINKPPKIVITSQHVHQPSNYHIYEMRFLNEKDSWELFTKVFIKSHNNVGLKADYYGLAKKELENCQGLASAIVELGRRSNNGWETRLHSPNMRQSPTDLYLPETNNKLALSYQHLPSHLKPCFLYLGFFPRDTTIKAGRLMRLWIAEGFVNCCHEETLEEEARKYLQELIDRRMVQVVERTYAGKPKTLQVHQMMTNLSLKKAQELDFLYSSEFSDQTAKNTSRRAAITLSNSPTLPVENPLLRSLLVYGGVDQHNQHGNQRKILELPLVLKRFKLLRVLDIIEIRTFDGVMPKDIGNLVHLRYLRIRSTDITYLPDTIGNLRKLITFVYRNVKVNNDGIRFPDVLNNLKRLRHLYLPLEKSNRTENLTLHTLKNLRTLWGVRGGDWMKEMPNLNLNLTKLCIQGIADEKLIVDSLFNCPMIKTQDNLQSLALEWFGVSLEGIEPLCSKERLLKLILKGRATDHSNSLKFPPNLQKLELYYTQLGNPKSMAALGELKCLKFLKLAKDSYIGSEWTIEAQNAFLQLEVLLLSGLPNLKIWKVGEGAMPCLKKLSVKYCPSLEHIPQELTSRNMLKILLKKEKPSKGK